MKKIMLAVGLLGGVAYGQLVPPPSVAHRMAGNRVGATVYDHGADPVLKGLTMAQVSIIWQGGAGNDESAIQTQVESALKQAGLYVFRPTDLSPEELKAVPLLYIDIGGNDTPVPVIVELLEGSILLRELNKNVNSAPWDEYNAWIKKQADQGIPFNEAENAEHYKQALAGLEKNAAVARPPDPRLLITWQRYGIAQTVQPESVRQITERYFLFLRSGSVTPAAGPFVQRMMDLEVQAAMANAQRPAIPAVRDTVNSLVNAFLNEWLAANKK